MHFSWETYARSRRHPAEGRAGGEVRRAQHIGAISEDGWWSISVASILRVDDVIRSRRGRRRRTPGVWTSPVPLHSCTALGELLPREWGRGNALHPGLIAERGSHACGIHRAGLTPTSPGSTWNGILPKNGSRYFQHKHFCCKHLCCKHFLSQRFHCTTNWPRGNFTVRGQITAWRFGFHLASNAPKLAVSWVSSLHRWRSHRYFRFYAYYINLSLRDGP